MQLSEMAIQETNSSNQSVTEYHLSRGNEKDDSFSSVQDFLHGHQKEDPDLWCANTISPVNPVHQEPASNSTAS